MAVLLVDNQVFKLQLFCKLNNQYAVNALDFRVINSAVGGVTDQAAVDELSSVFGTLLRDCMSNDASYFGAKLTIYDPVLPVPVVSNVGAGNGSDNSQALPSQTCGLIKKMTAFAGRRGRGRIYIPFPSEDFNSDDGFPTAGYLAVAEAVALQLRTTVGVVLGAGSAEMQCGLARITLGAPTFIPITVTNVRTAWATQRRRSSINQGDSVPF